MRLMATVTGICIVVALGVLFAIHGWASIHLYIATAVGIGFSMMLMAALMGLVFLSNGTGHDEAVDNFMPDRDDDER